jgi:hypothetical protein
MHAKYCLLVLSLALSAAACGDDSSPSEDTSAATDGSADQQAISDSSQGMDACTQLCAVAEPLQCPNDTAPCLTECGAYYDSPVCRDELRALIECSITRPASDWICNAAGEADVEPPACAGEHEAVDACAAAAQ